ncbi:hypothetical protein AWC22_15780 [Mycobacterium riyadhense]|uniref:Uncharacterized protein n=1 Tax=Mycobacterium riyadhense TaxID=486698 RepID=A0A1X2D377_9MYCO|nr:hypothetical protein AWC22_15780 [Mycobacterium riyadhense]VTO96591.1 hypothetical protein BIN_B_01658 [Mycobacterium riyadhense]
MDGVSFSDLQLCGKATLEGWLRESANRVLLARRSVAAEAERPYHATSNYVWSVRFCKAATAVASGLHGNAFHH